MKNKLIAVVFVVLLIVPSFAKISNISQIETDENRKFSKDQLKKLDDHGFFIIPNDSRKPSSPDETTSNFDEMVTSYKDISGDSDEYARCPENTVFITSDFMLHLYHVLIDRTFQAIEEEKFYPTSLKMTNVLFKSALAAYNKEAAKEAPDQKNLIAKKRAALYFLVPLCLLKSGEKNIVSNDTVGSDMVQEFKVPAYSNKDDALSILNSLQGYKKLLPADMFDIAKGELKKISDAETVVKSDIFPDSYKEMIDYTQFVPRSHYTKNKILSSYFRALMWYGRIGFPVDNEEMTRVALNIVSDMKTAKVLKDWESIYNPTVFFVGKSDDLSIYEYSKILDEMYGADNWSQFESDPISKFQAKVASLQGPKIMSAPVVFDPSKGAPKKEDLLASTKGFRFMGQRFIPDSYIFSKLTQGQEAPDVETGQSLPSMPTGLMVMSVLGSKTADTLLDNWISKEAPDSDKVIANAIKKLKGEFNSYDEKTWTQNIYWRWLYTLKSLFNDSNEKYPSFMKTQAWQKKCLLSSFGSWTELRHDTLLYAKQSGAEMGGGDNEGKKPAVPKGYVEANDEFFNRLLALNDATVSTLTKFKLLNGENSSNYTEKYTAFSSILKFLNKVVTSELSNEKISDEDYERLRTLPYETVRIVSPVPYNDLIRNKDSWNGLIADVHTDFSNGKILYEAIGTPMRIFVLVKDNAGTRLTRGLTYSYYEFANPLEKRMTDEDWQGIIYEKKSEAPSMPEWTKDILEKP